MSFNNSTSKDTFCSLVSDTNSFFLSESHSLLQLVLPVLGQMKIPDSIDERQKMFEFKDKPLVAGILLDFLLDVLLMPYRFVNYFSLAL